MKGFKTEFEDLLPEPEPTLPPSVFRWVYPFFHIVWGISVLACPILTVFTEAVGIYFIVMLPLVLFSFVMSGLIFVRQHASSYSHRSRFDAFVFYVFIASCILTGACFFLNMIYGGGPEQTEEGYFIIDHNQIVRSISEIEYRILSVSETLIFASGLCIFTSKILLHARNKYDEAKKKEKSEGTKAAWQ